MLVSASVFSDEMEILPGANIIEVGTKNGTTSDANGRFNLNVASPKSDLMISYVGYKTVLISAQEIGSYIELPPNVEMLEEITVNNNYQPKPKSSNTLGWLALLALGTVGSYFIFRKKQPPTVKI